MSFSSILEKAGRIDTGLLLLTMNFESPLYKGITLASLSSCGTTPLDKDRLKTYVNGLNEQS